MMAPADRNLRCPVCGMATVPGLTCACPPVRTPLALAHLLEDALREQRRQDDDDRTERGGERDPEPRDEYGFNAEERSDADD